MNDILYEINEEFCCKCRKFFPKGTIIVHMSSSGKRKVLLCPDCVDISKRGLKKQQLRQKQKTTTT